MNYRLNNVEDPAMRWVTFGQDQRRKSEGLNT